MNLKTNIMANTGLIGVQGAIHAAPVSDQEKFWASLIIGVVQFVISILAHHYNTNGDGQELPGGQAAPKA